MKKCLSLIATSIATLMILCASPLPATAQDDPAASLFSLPVDCTLDKDCWLVNYVDVDPSAGALDYQCGTRSYNDHNGTDIAIPDYVSMQSGVNVLAAADGTVLRLRDSVADWPPITDDEDAAKKRADIRAKNQDCGNGVFIEHDNGYTGIYCHMKKDSIAVKVGQKVKRGEILGQVGMSGFTEFPHLHFGIYKDGKTIDPFTRHTSADGCDKPKNPLWDATFPRDDYKLVSFFGGGFKNHVPDFDALAIDISQPDSIAIDSDIFTFWIGMYGVRAGDQIKIEIRGPDNRLYLKKMIAQKNDKARQYYFVGKKTANDPLQAGYYGGYVQLTRTGPDGNRFSADYSTTIKVE